MAVAVARPGGLNGGCCGKARMFEWRLLWQGPGVRMAVAVARRGGSNGSGRGKARVFEWRLPWQGPDVRMAVARPGG
jgi:hypothetical protein